MHWVVLSFLTAFFESLKDLLSRQRLDRQDLLLLAWSWRFFALPLLLPALLLDGLPQTGSHFWGALAVSGSLNTLTSLLYMRALRGSDLSLTVPMLAFTPLFLLGTSPLLLGEFPDGTGVAGVLLIVGGSYLMKVDALREGWLAPFGALLRESGPRWMLVVALIWSVTANVDKIGIQNSSPLLWAVSVHLTVSLLLLPPLVLRRRQWRRGRPSIFRDLLPIGLAGGLTTICQMSALQIALVPYVISIKRTSLVMGVLWGHFVLGEKGFRSRLAGSTLMAVGVVLIVL